MFSDCTGRVTWWLSFVFWGYYSEKVGIKSIGYKENNAIIIIETERTKAVFSS